MVLGKKQILRWIPEPLKTVLRPCYRRLTRRPPDRSSALEIDSVGGFEIAYRTGTADESVLDHSFNNDVFFKGFPDYQPSDSPVIVDIGAHIGTFSLQSSARAAGGRIYALEAGRDSFNLLRINIALNRCHNISAHHLAISDKDGQCTLYHSHEGNWSNSTVKALSKMRETVNCCTLASFFDRHRITACDYLKMNCEGAEFPVLLASPREILSRIRLMLVMYHRDTWTANTEADLAAHLEACGFECVVQSLSRIRGWVIGTNTAWQDSADTVRPAEE